MKEGEDAEISLAELRYEVHQFAAWSGLIEA
jgi:hypothetical protein